MRYLLDTHALLWWLEDSDRLSERVRELIGDGRNDVFVSAASAWEIAVKFAKGKLPSASILLPDFAGLVSGEGFAELPITSAHMVRSTLLPGDHRDPFDRILAAQAIIESMGLITNDALIPGFGVMTVWEP